MLLQRTNASLNCEGFCHDARCVGSCFAAWRDDFIHLPPPLPPTAAAMHHTGVNNTPETGKTHLSQCRTGRIASLPAQKYIRRFWSSGCLWRPLWLYFSRSGQCVSVGFVHAVWRKKKRQQGSVKNSLCKRVVFGFKEKFGLRMASS